MEGVLLIMLLVVMLVDMLLVGNILLVRLDLLVRLGRIILPCTCHHRRHQVHRLHILLVVCKGEE